MLRLTPPLNKPLKDTLKKFMLTLPGRFQPRKRHRMAEHAVVDGKIRIEHSWSKALRVQGLTFGCND